MKNLITCIALLFLSAVGFSQAQPQGEFHKHIVKKTDADRRKTKPDSWWDKGVIVFSTSEIKRLGTIAETGKIVAEKFKVGQTIYGRAFMPLNIGKLERKPLAIITRFYLDGKLYNSEIIYKDDTMLDDAWSSWSYIFPEDMPKLFEELSPGEHVVKVEVWTDVPTEKTTTYVDENNVAVGTKKEDINRGQFLGAGDFKIVK